MHANFQTGPAPDWAPDRARRLRIATYVVLGAQALYWFYTVWVGMSRADDYRGYQWMGAFFSTPGFIIFTVPALILHLTGVLRNFAFAWACLGFLIVPFVAWGILAAALIDALAGR